MTPSNPSNSQPLIYRIMDALGVTHLVACLNHTHDQSEVEGLTAALAAKLAKLTSFTAGNFVKVKSDGTLEDSGKKASDFADAAATATALAGKQATLTFDSTPTDNSTNPVTSGGVKAALNRKVDLSNFSEIVDRLDSFTTSDVDEKINLPTAFDDDHYSTTYIIENYTSEDRTLESFFNEGSDSLVCEPNKIIHHDSYVIARVIGYDNGSNTLFFVVVEGIYEM